jgi:hypothetical protein
MKSVINSNFSHGFDKVSTLSASDAPLSANASRFSGLLASSLLLVIGAALCLMVFNLNSKILDSSLALTQKASMISFKDYALLKIESKKQYGCLARLWGAESAWNPLARNNSHYGIPQGKSVYLSTVDGYKQINWGLDYLAHRYKLDQNGYINACAAWEHFKKRNWH